MTGHLEPWNSLNDENLTADTRQNFDFSTEEEEDVSSPAISSDEEVVFKMILEPQEFSLGFFLGFFFFCCTRILRC